MISIAVAASALLLESGIGEVAQSPFIIPVAGCMMVLGIVVVSIWAGVRSQEMKSQERLAAIARGIVSEPTWDESAARTAMPHAGVSFKPPNDGSGARRAGIVLVSIGSGMLAFFLSCALIMHVQHDRDDTAGFLIAAATGLVPLAIGIGFLVDARLRRAEFRRLYPVGPGIGSSAPAQLSEFRPLH